jgi:hypothetical protein
MLLYNIIMRSRYLTACVINYVWQVKRRFVSLLPTYLYSLDDSSQPASHIRTLARTLARTEAYIHVVLFLEKILETDYES